MSLIEVNEATLKVNRFARRNRHMRIFSKGQLWRFRAKGALRSLIIPARFLAKQPGVSHALTALSTVKLLIPSSPQKKLLFQAATLSLAAVFVTSLTPGGTFTAASLGYSAEYIEAYALPGDVLVANEDGYLVKINPQTDNANRVGLTDFAVHSVEGGETLSGIAEKYGVAVSTIMWENGLGNANSLRVGQQLMVPPVDGISYSVSSGDNLEKIASKYEITVDAIVAQNALDSNVVAKGQALFLPGAKPIYQAPVATRSATASRGATRSYANVSASTAAPAAGASFIFPTRGKITQGYRAGHYAYDIADRSKPPIWAAGAGTVVKASSGTWGGGYGNHIIVDHGNGLQTLYAHLDTLNVYVGQAVGQGDVLGIMGNTGRVYGATGIHLHWEVIQNGVRQNPRNYY